MTDLKLSILEKYLNENTSLHINKEEIRNILNNNEGRTINIIKQFDSIIDTNKDYSNFRIEEVDSIKTNEFIITSDNFRFKSDELIIKPEMDVSKSAFNKVKYISSNYSTPKSNSSINIYDNYRNKRKVQLLTNIFESINNLEKTLNRFKNI